MRNNPEIAPPKSLWYLRQALKYFLATLLSLAILVIVVLALLYFQVISIVAPAVLQASMGAIFIRFLIVVLVILLILAVMGSWFLTRASARQKKLKAQVEFDGQVFDVSTDSIMVHGLDGHFIYANEVAYKSHGYNKEELMGIGLYELNSPGHAKSIEAQIKELVETGQLTFESSHIRKDKSPMPVEVNSRIIESGGQKLILSAVRDTTERKRTEEELRETSQKLRRAMEGTINAVALTTEIRDPYTAGHQQRVAELACAIAKELGLPEQRIEGMRVAGVLHDIGKIYVPAEILSKPGQLRKNELNLIKDHAQVGYDLLKTIEFSWPVAQIALQHHERMDGSGYPLGISGEDILLEARIMGVADVVEAMSSHRPYRPALSIEKALLEIIQKKGVLYDPEVVDACVKLFSEKGFKFEELKRS